MQHINNTNFSNYLNDFVAAKGKNPKLGLYSQNNGALLFATKGTQKVEFDALLQEVSARNFTMKENLAVARNIQKLSELEKPSKFASLFAKKTVQTQKERVAEVLAKLTLSAQNEAASTIQKGYRRHLQAKKVLEKAAIDYKKQPPAAPETLFQKIMRIIRSIFNAVFGSKQPEKNEPSTQEVEVVPSSPCVSALKKDLNKEYVAIFDSLGQKKGCPTIVSSKLEGTELTLNHNKPAELTFEYLGAKGSLSISQEIQMRFEKSDNQASTTFKNPIPVKVKFPFCNERSYQLNQLVLENNKITLILKIGNDDKVVPLDIEKIKSIANRLSWATTKS